MDGAQERDLATWAWSLGLAPAERSVEGERL